MLKYLALAAVISMAAPFSHAAACPWLPLQVVRDALPQFEPWKVDAGSGAGLCTFVGESSKVPGTSTSMPRLTFTQQAQPDAAAAAKFTREFRAASADVYRIKQNTKLGSEGFSALPKDEKDTSMAYWTGHNDKAVLMVTMMRNDKPNSADLLAVDGVVAKALAAATKPGVAEKALACPYFEPTLIAKLLPTQGLKTQQFGEDSCMSNTDDSSVVMLMRVVAQSASERAQLMKGLVDKDCSNESAPSLGAGGVIEFACKSGNARATAHFVKGNSIYSVNHIPINREPTKAERDTLLKLAESIVANAAAK